MASEITGTRETLDNGREQATMVYYWPLATPVLDAGDVPVVPVTDASNIPLKIAKRMPQDQKDAIAAGDAIYELVTLVRSLDETETEFVARARLDRLALMPAVEAAARSAAVYDDRWFQVDG